MRVQPHPGTRQALSRLGFSLPKGLPHKEYSLCDGRVSVVLDQQGGINMVEYHGPRRSDTLRQGAFFSNGDWLGEAFFPEPVLEFQLGLAGRPVPWRFTDVALAPFSVSAHFAHEGHDFGFLIWLKGNAVYLQWDASVPSTVALRVREGFLSRGNDEAAWESPVFEPRLGACRYGLMRRREPGARLPESQSHLACAILGPMGKAHHEVLPDGRRLVAALGPRQPSRWAIAFAEDYAGAKELFRAAAGTWEKGFAEQERRYGTLAASTPSVEGRGVPVPLADLVRTAPLFVESMRIERNAKQVGLRGATRGDGMGHGPDGQWGALLLNACGSGDTVPRYLECLDAARGPNGAIPMRVDANFGALGNPALGSGPHEGGLAEGGSSMHELYGISSLQQYVARTGDRATLRKLWPGFARSLRTICGRAYPLGLVESCLGGADGPGEAGFPIFAESQDRPASARRGSAPEDMGVLFHGCVQGAELAATLGDCETSRACRDVAGRLLAGFSGVFLDPASGFLFDSVWSDGDPSNRHASPRLTALLALFGYGELLLLDSIGGLARFVRARMRHPEMGLRAVPTGSPSSPFHERWKDSWPQAQTRETLKLARMAGDRELLDLQVEALLRNFAADRLVHEGLHCARRGGRHDPAKLFMSTSRWKGMTAFAWWTGLLESVVGLRFDRGLPEYVLGDAGIDLDLSNFQWGGRRWSMSVKGRGKWIGSMRINGRERAGACSLLPSDRLREQKVAIQKTDRPPSAPLILTAGASPVSSCRAGRGTLRATIVSPGFSVLHFYSPARPVLLVGNKEVPFHWAATRSEGVALLEGKGNLGVEIHP